MTDGEERKKREERGEGVMGIGERKGAIGEAERKREKDKKWKR